MSNNEQITMVKLTARKVNEAASELSQRMGYKELGKFYQEMAVKAACENKGIVEVESDDAIIGVIQSIEKS